LVLGPLALSLLAFVAAAVIEPATLAALFEGRLRLPIDVRLPLFMAMFAGVFLSILVGIPASVILVERGETRLRQFLWPGLVVGTIAIVILGWPVFLTTASAEPWKIPILLGV